MFAIVGLNTKTNSQTITSIANGNWSSTSTWGGTPPYPGSTVVINHTVTLDLDYGFATGGITVNSSGALNGNIPMRALAVSGGTLTVNGTLNIARVALYGGTVTNSGTFQNDSLLDVTSLTNNSGATINATQFMINTGGTLNNNGSVVSTNFLNVSTVTNTGIMTSSDFMNSKTFTNSTTGEIMAFDFLNSDSLASSAVFTNNGRVTVTHDFSNIVVNSALIDGSGKFCIQNNSFNSGTMSGTFDFCDQTGGNVDYNTGTIAGTITNCTFSCATGIDEDLNNLSVNLYPNPSNGIFSINFKNVNTKKIIEIYNVLGERVYSTNLFEEKTEIDLSTEKKGIYFFQLKTEKEIIKTGKIIIE